MKMKKTKNFQDNQNRKQQTHRVARLRQQTFYQDGIYEFQVAWQTATSLKLDLEITLLLHEQASNTTRMPADAEPQAANQSNLSNYRIVSANGANLQVRWCRECFIILTLAGGVTPEKHSKTSFSWGSYNSIELAWKDVVATSGWDRPVRKLINNPERDVDQ